MLMLTHTEPSDEIPQVLSCLSLWYTFLYQSKEFLQKIIIIKTGVVMSDWRLTYWYLIMPANSGGREDGRISVRTLMCAHRYVRAGAEYRGSLSQSKGPFILLCRIFSVECPTNFECTLVNCHLKLVWSLNFEIVFRLSQQMASS